MPEGGGQGPDGGTTRRLPPISAGVGEEGRLSRPPARKAPGQVPESAAEAADSITVRSMAGLGQRKFRGKMSPWTRVLGLGLQCTVF